MTTPSIAGGDAGGRRTAAEEWDALPGHRIWPPGWRGASPSGQRQGAAPGPGGVDEHGHRRLWRGHPEWWRRHDRFDAGHGRRLPWGSGCPGCAWSRTWSMTSGARCTSTMPGGAVLPAGRWPDVRPDVWGTGARRAEAGRPGRL